jgi:hypothetical protein
VQAEAATGLDHLQATQVVAGEDADGLGQLFEPGYNLGLFVAIPTGTAGVVDGTVVEVRIQRLQFVTGQAHGGGTLFEAPAAFLGPELGTKAAKCQVAVAALEEVFGSQLSHCRVVGANFGDAGEGLRMVAQVHTGNPHLDAAGKKLGREVFAHGTIPMLGSKQPVGITPGSSIVIHKSAPPVVKPVVRGDGIQNFDVFFGLGHKDQGDLGLVFIGHAVLQANRG